MSEYKYTSDGKKVAVIGKLNATQHIVQEIFIIDGQEVPSGENFVVASLHDAPAESHLERRVREMQERAERVEKETKRRIADANRRESEAVSKAKLRADALFAFAKNSDSDELQLLRAWLSGEITHVFIQSHQPQIVTYDDDEMFGTDSFHGKRYEALKLVSLFGSSDGRLSFQLSCYSDGSGGHVEMLPARSYDEALSIAQDRCNIEVERWLSGSSNYLNLEGWQRIDGISIPDKALEKYRQDKESERQKKIAKLKSELAELQQEQSA